VKDKGVHSADYVHTVRKSITLSLFCN